MIFKSVFAKYMLAFVVIILISFSVLALIVANQVINYSNQVKNDELEKIATSSAAILEPVYEGSEIGDFTEFVYSEKLMLEKVFGYVDNDDEVNVFLTDSNGKILWYATMLDSNKEMYLDNTKMVPRDAVQSILDGEGLDIEKTTLGGTLGHPCYVEALPIEVEGKTSGILFVTTVSSKMYEFVSSTVKTIIMSCMWVMCGAIIASYFINERIVRPIKKVSHAAKEFADGKMDVRVPVTGTDEVAELAMAFNNMASSLERNEETRRMFLANVSHDMRTPMTTIGGFIDAILDGTIPPEESEHYLTIVSSEVKRLSRLVSTLLDISKIQAGERKFTMEEFDICELSRQIIISLEQRLNDKKLDVEFECDADNIWVVADRDAIYQVLYNICDNGVKFAREGGKYRLCVRMSDSKVLVSVYNEGDGIPDGDLPYVFDRFYKSDKSRGLDKTGVGLGMYISRTIMDAHGETISVRSTHGEFCEFTITLKRHE
ncbi:MAG: HAMP domain-containing histidine kinase [Ruminococcaceae bacterium]|nr:HAMP domain-containing histidine kinase [Oscillospiraceae bacterium]